MNELLTHGAQRRARAKIWKLGTKFYNLGSESMDDQSQTAKSIFECELGEEFRLYLLIRGKECDRGLKRGRTSIKELSLGTVVGELKQQM